MHFLPWREHQWSAELGHVHELYHFCHVRKLYGTQNGIKLNLKGKKRNFEVSTSFRITGVLWGGFFWVVFIVGV